MKIGVLALQGAFIEHIEALEKLGVEAPAVRLLDELQGLDGLIIPGGESTSILNLMHGYGIFELLKKMVGKGFPVFGTCAGLICLAKGVHNSGSFPIETLSLMDIQVKRNAFGRQVDSFETELEVPLLGKKPFPAVFIRAPVIERAAPGVDVLATLPDGTIAAAKQGKLLVTTFHPELTDDSRFHRYFLDIASNGSH